MAPRGFLVEAVTCIFSLSPPEQFWFCRVFWHLFHYLGHLQPKWVIVKLFSYRGFPIHFIFTVDCVHMFSNPVITFFAVKFYRGGSWQGTAWELDGSSIAVSFILYCFSSNLQALTMDFGHHWALIWCFHGTIHFIKQATLSYAYQRSIKSC